MAIVAIHLGGGPCNGAASAIVGIDHLQLKAVQVAPGQFGWSLTKPLPADSDVQLADDQLRQVLLNNLAIIRAGNGKGKYSPLPQFVGTMTRGTGSFNLSWKLPTPTALTDPPPSRLEGTYTPSGPIHPTTLKIVVNVVGSAQIDANPVATTVGELEAHGVAGLPPLSGDDAKTVVLIVGNKQPGNHPATWINAPEYLLAYQVAVHAFASAKSNQLQGQSTRALGINQPRMKPVPGTKPLPDQAVSSDVSTYILKNFGLFGSWQAEAGMLVNAQLNDSTHVWTVTAPLQAVGDVSFQISGFHTTTKDFSSWSAFSKTNWYAANPKAFEANKAKVKARMTEILEKQFQELRHTLVSTEQFDSVAKEISNIVTEKRATEPPTFALAEASDIAVQAVLWPTKTALSIGGGYSSDKGPYGSVNATITKNGMTGSLNAEAGQKKQDGTLSFSQPSYFNSSDHRWAMNLDITGNLNRATGLQLNRPNEPTTDENSAKGEILNTLKYTSKTDASTSDPNASASAPLYLASLQTGVGYSSVSFDQHNSGKDPLEGGGILYARASLSQEWTRRFVPAGAPGLGSIDVLGQFDIKDGFDAGPGDYAFLSVSASLAGTCYFGPVSSGDYFARAILGGGGMTGKAPVSEEFEIGGNKILHGFEQDERTARGLSWQSLELGASLEALLRFLPSAVANTASQALSGAKGGGTGAAKPEQNPLQMIYVSGFAEFAEITQNSVSQNQRLSSSLQSYGAALDVNLNAGSAAGGGGTPVQLRVGYAWSPESIHHGGLIFTDISIPLSF